MAPFVVDSSTPAAFLRVRRSGIPAGPPIASANYTPGAPPLISAAALHEEVAPERRPDLRHISRQAVGFTYSRRLAASPPPIPALRPPVGIRLRAPCASPKLRRCFREIGTIR